jgi:CheY-like chemotaxis protein
MEYRWAPNVGAQTGANGRDILPALPSAERCNSPYDEQTGLEIAAKLKPDYLLTDVLMPVMNGVEFAMAVTKMLPETRILLFSGQVGISDIFRQGEEKGYVFDLVAKPIHPEKLIERLKKK